MKQMSDVMWVVCNKLTTVWAPTKKLLISWQFSGPYGVTKYGSGWRKYVVNQYLEFAATCHHLNPSPASQTLTHNTTFLQSQLWLKFGMILLLLLSHHLCQPQRCCSRTTRGIPSPCHIPDSFGIAGLLPEVHSRGNIVGRLSSEGDTAQLPNHFGGVDWCLLWFSFCRTLPTLPAVAAADDDDHFYIVLFSALEQTHCARMWFYMSE